MVDNKKRLSLVCSVVNSTYDPSQRSLRFSGRASMFKAMLTTFFDRLKIYSGDRIRITVEKVDKDIREGIYYE